MDRPDTRDELLDALKGDRGRVLHVLTAHDELRSSKIREWARIPQGSKHYQLSTLESWGLIEQTGTVESDDSDQFTEKVYSITEEGRLIAKDVSMEPEEAEEYFRMLTAEIESVSDEVEDIQKRQAELEDRFETLKDWVKERLYDEYWNRITNEIDQRIEQYAKQR